MNNKHRIFFYQQFPSNKMPHNKNSGFRGADKHVNRVRKGTSSFNLHDEWCDVQQKE